MNFSSVPAFSRREVLFFPPRIFSKTLCRKCHFCERCDIVVHTSGAGHCCHWCWIKGKSYPSAKQLVNFSPVLCFHTSCIAQGHILVLYQSSLHQQVSLICFVTEHRERRHCTFHALHYTETLESLCVWVGVMLRIIYDWQKYIFCFFFISCIIKSSMIIHPFVAKW
jgi:hypothetical protein